MMSIYSDALDDIEISLKCDLKEDWYSSTDPNVATIQSEIYRLRSEDERRKQIAWELLTMLHTGGTGLKNEEFNRFDTMLRAIAGPVKDEENP